MTSFGRRSHSERVGRAGLGVVGVSIQPVGATFDIFKRALADGAEELNRPLHPIKSETTPL